MSPILVPNSHRFLVGDANGNAMSGRFFATLECELIDRQRFRSQTEARMAVFKFIEGWYNPRWRHSTIGYLSVGEMGTFIFSRVMLARGIAPCSRKR